MNDPNYVLFEYSIDEEIFDDYILRFINYFQNREPLKDWPNISSLEPFKEMFAAA